MSTNMELITSVTVGSGGAASVTLPATGTIPQTYTDLKVVASTRQSGSAEGHQLGIRFNGSSVSEYSRKVLYGDGSTASTAGGSSETFARIAFTESSTYTANTFNNFEIYIPNYTSSNYKSFSSDAVSENNAIGVYAQALYAGLWSNTSAITSITLSEYSGSGTNFVEGSTFYLYGISNVTSTTKATGGIVSSDGTYNYHMFPYSGTFTPTTAISADVLCIAGGGGTALGGGGAGGYRLLSSQSLTAIGYSVTIGAGGAGDVYNGTPTKGGNSSLIGGAISITSTGGGQSGTTNTGSQVGKIGGSGGGAAGDGTGGGAGGAGNEGGYSPVEGYAGGTSVGVANYNGGGGGGSSAVGGNATTSVPGAGGAATQLSSWANATQTGVNGYYAGGGAGGSAGANDTNTGGGGGGGNTNTPGVANTGGGAGGGISSSSFTGKNGGSGLVIIRYAI